MKKLTALIAGALVVAVAVPALAGEGHYEKCSADAQACLDKMATKLHNKGFMGIEFDKNEDGQYIIKKVIEDAPAATAGFKVGDIVLSVNEAKWDDREAMKKVDWSPGSQMTVKIKRGGKKQVLNLTLATMPDEVVAKYIGAHMIEDHVAVAVADGK
jgi:C-terminal processing protease CtpA/Prc